MEKDVFETMGKDPEFNAMFDKKKHEKMKKTVPHRFTRGEEEKLKNILEDKYEYVLPWVVGGGLGAGALTKEAHAQAMTSCPLKCPTFQEANKVS